MLSDEEKKAIEIIKFLQYKCIEENGTGMMPIYRIDDLANAIKIILNLIEKQQKEIEELKEKIKTFKIEDENIYLQFGEITEKKRWQDKIKAKMKEKEWSLENYDCDKSDYKHSQAIGAWCVLQSLLEKGVDMTKKEKQEIERIIERLEAKPYTAYTLYGDILHESDEIAQMLKEVLEKE